MTLIKKQIAALTLMILTTAGIAAGGGRDNNPLNAGETQFRNSWGLTLDGAMGNPSLLGLDNTPRNSLSFLPLSVALWSDKLAIPLDMSVVTNPSRYLANSMRESFGLTDDAAKNSEILTRELRDGIDIYAGVKVSPIVFATRGFGLNAGAFADVDVKIPGGLMLLLFSDTAGLLANGDSLHLSDMRLSAVAASEIAVKLGCTITIPFLRDRLGLDKGATGMGIKLLLGHAYLNAEMAKGSAIFYDTASNKYKTGAQLNVLTAGTSFDGGFRYNTGKPVTGQGWGLDFGTIFRNNNHAFSIDVQDIGMIVWNGRDVSRGRMKLELGPDRDGFDLSDLYLSMDEIFGFSSDTLEQNNKNYIMWLPTALNAGYSYSLQFDRKRALGYLTTGFGYKQQLLLGIGHNTYQPRFSAGAALGLLAGHLPLRYGITYGGPEKLASAVGIGIDARYISIDAFYKAIGSPILQAAKGFEAGGAVTFRWGFKRGLEKVKDRPKAGKPAAEAAEADTAAEPALPDLEFFPDEDESEEIYEPIEINIFMLPPKPPQPETETPPPTPETETPLPTPETQPTPTPSPETETPPPETKTEPSPPQLTADETQKLGAAQRAINFVQGSANLTGSSYAPLDTIANLLSQYPDIRYEVQGHTDSQGDEMYNLLLSSERAAVVKYYLMLRGAPESSLVAVGYGKNIPIADNKTVVGRALNRRVEFVPIQSQEHYDWVKRFELEMIPRLTHRIINGRIIVEMKKDDD
jgi:outer membrane protein OmpA-like peptidoglycan-associated protein